MFKCCECGWGIYEIKILSVLGSKVIYFSVQYNIHMYRTS
jgi:hypothetical protein